MHSQRAFSCRSKSKRIPKRFSSRRRSLSTSDLPSKASTTPIFSPYKQDTTLNTIEKTIDNKQVSKEHTSEQDNDENASEIITRAATSPGDLQTQEKTIEENLPTVFTQNGNLYNSKISEHINNTNCETYI